MRSVRVTKVISQIGVPTYRPKEQLSLCYNCVLTRNQRNCLCNVYFLVIFYMLQHVSSHLALPSFSFLCTSVPVFLLVWLFPVRSSCVSVCSLSAYHFFFVLTLLCFDPRTKTSSWVTLPLHSICDNSLHSHISTPYKYNTS